MKPTLVLLPGLLNDARLWAHQCQALADVAESMVGDLTGADSIDALAASVLAAAPPRFALAGLSMGGYTAMAIMRMAPERVTRLALFDTTARPDTPEQTARRKDAIALALGGGFSKIMPTMLSMLVAPGNLGRVGGLATAMADAVGPEAFVRQQSAIMGRPDSRPFLERIRCPALVACGRLDTLTPPDRHEEMAALIPGARLEFIEDSGHLSPIEQPEATSALLRSWIEG